MTPTADGSHRLRGKQRPETAALRTFTGLQRTTGPAERALGDVGALTELEAQTDDGQRDPPRQQQEEETVSTQHLVKSLDGVLF